MWKEELCGKVVEVRMVSHRVIAVALLFEENVLNLCGYHTQSRRNFEENNLYDETKNISIKTQIISGN